MSEHVKPLLHELVASLRGMIQRVSSSGPLEKAFVAWLFPKDCPVTIDLKDIAATATAASGAQRTYREVATLGFISSIQPLSSKEAKALGEGLSWLIARPAFSPNGTPSFEVHGLALLGIALGTMQLPIEERSKAISWMAGFLPKSAKSKVSVFNRAMIAAAATAIEKAEAAPFDENAISACAKVVCSKKGLMTADESVAAVALSEILGSGTEKDEVSAAALKLSCLELIFRGLTDINFRALRITDVATVLSRVPHALKRWTWEEFARTGRQGASPLRWEIENEYHLQNLLWTILSPIFSDLDDEENVKSSGPAHPRADLCIPSLQLVIEAKFMRSASQSEQARILNELAADASLYCVPGSGFSKIIPVIWDNSRTTEHHAEMIKGLEALANVEKAFVISRPGKMLSSIKPSSPSRARSAAGSKRATKKKKKRR